MLCFGCHTDWAEYYDRPNNILYLTPNTCDSVYSQCSDMLVNLNTYAGPILDDLIGIVNNSAQANPNVVEELRGYKQLVLSSGSICRPLGFDDCKELVCHGYLHGLVASLNLMPPAPTLLENRIGHLLNVGHQKATPELDALAQLVEPIDFIFKHLFSSPSKLQSNQFELQAPPGNNHVYNSYGNGSVNYDAYNYGCECELSTHACPKLASSASRTKQQDIIIGFSIGGVALFLVLIAFIFYIVQRRKSGQHENHVPLEEEYEAPNNQQKLIEEGSGRVSVSEESTHSDVISPNPNTTAEPSTSSDYITPGPSVISQGSIN